MLQTERKAKQQDIMISYLILILGKFLIRDDIFPVSKNKKPI